MSNYVLIPAAGSGARMGSEIPKQYLTIHGKPLIHHTLSVFESHPAITRIVVVLSPDDTRWTHDSNEKITVLRCGGETRAESVLNGLNAMQAWVAADDWVLVHDAARPCLSRALLDQLLEALLDDPVGGLLAVPVADTLKRENGQGRVAQTEPRAGLWRAQTPQMFRHGLLQRALSEMGTAAPTDEAQAIEFLGLSPKLVAGDGLNLKVTYPEDLAMAGWILQGNRC
jgi:2-C-methyl-D-erythritol 4-phosphate cytidylyltransferase